MLDDKTAEMIRLQGEVSMSQERLRKDAARYQWIKKHSTLELGSYNGPDYLPNATTSWWYIRSNSELQGTNKPPDMDAAIDAANREEDIKAGKGIVRSLDEGITLAKEIGFPCKISPGFTIGGGGGTANNMDEFIVIAQRALTHSLSCEILIEAVEKEK